MQLFGLILNPLGMVVDSTGTRPASAKIKAVAKISRPTHVEESRALLGLTGYMRQPVERCSMIAYLFMGILHSRTFATKHVRKLSIPRTEKKGRSILHPYENLSASDDAGVPELESTVHAVHGH